MFAPITREPKALAQSMSTKHEVKQDWEKLYRAAIVEPDRSKLLQRVEDAEAAIRERSRNLSKSPANSGKEQEAIARALRILTLLRAKAGV
jgi:seryl-tRNA synthetase